MAPRYSALEAITASLHPPGSGISSQIGMDKGSNSDSFGGTVTVIAVVCVVSPTEEDAGKRAIRDVSIVASASRFVTLIQPWPLVREPSGLVPSLLMISLMMRLVAAREFPATRIAG